MIPKNTPPTMIEASIKPITIASRRNIYSTHLLNDVWRLRWDSGLQHLVEFVARKNPNEIETSVRPVIHPGIQDANIAATVCGVPSTENDRVTRHAKAPNL